MYYLDSLQLRGFRNYHNQLFNFHPRFNVITGDNGQGKTNLLEAVYYLSITKSFRTNHDFELINFNSDYFYLSGLFVKSYISHRVQMSYCSKKPLQVKIDHKTVPRFSNLQQFPVVSFSPDDLRIVKDGPQVRRKFLNLEGSRLNPLFFQELKKYQRVLLQRNNLLKKQFAPHKIVAALEPWNEALVESGSRIRLERIKLLKRFQEEANHIFKKLTGGREELTLTYKSSFKLKADADDYDKIKQNYFEALLAKRPLELKRGSTLTGPHLDDFYIFINEVKKYLKS